MEKRYSDSYGDKANKEPLTTTAPGATENVKSKEKKSLTDRTAARIAVGVLAVSMMTSSLSGCGAEKKNVSIQVEQTQDKNSKTTKQEIPAEAKTFVENYKTRYGTDVLSVYYADKALGGRKAVYWDEFFDAYEAKDPDLEKKSIFGFSIYELGIDVPANVDTAVKIFNEYTAPMLSRYMNLLARNTSQESIDIINTEFKNYCSFAKYKYNGPLPDSEEMGNMMSFAQEIVRKYGYAANYTVAPAVKGYSNDPSVSMFKNDKTYIKAHEASDGHKTTAIYDFDNAGEKVVVLIDKFTGAESERIIEAVDDVDLKISRYTFVEGAYIGSKDPDAIPTTRISIGIIK